MLDYEALITQTVGWLCKVGSVLTNSTEKSSRMDRAGCYSAFSLFYAMASVPVSKSGSQKSYILLLHDRLFLAGIHGKLSMQVVYLPDRL